MVWMWKVHSGPSWCGRLASAVSCQVCLLLIHKEWRPYEFIMFLLRLRAGRFVLCGPRFDCLFHLGRGGQQRYYYRCRQNCEPFLFCFSPPMFSVFSIPGERERRSGRGVAWYLLVGILHPPDISLLSPGMMGVLDVAGWQERFSAKT